MNTAAPKTSFLLMQDLAPLQERMEHLGNSLALLEEERRVAEAELATYAVDRQRFDALGEVCSALDKLEELGAAELFWGEAPHGEAGSTQRQRLRARIAGFEGEIQGVVHRRQVSQDRMERVLAELDELQAEVLEAHAREQRRLEEFVVEREISPVPWRTMVMPWTGDGEGERRFRRALLVALFWSMALGTLIPLMQLPLPDRTAALTEIPERLAMLVRKEPPKAVPLPPRLREEKKVEPEAAEPEKPEQAPKQSAPENQVQVAKAPAPAADPGTLAARKKAETAGVLAFKSSFADLMEATPVAKLGAEARLSKKSMAAAGQARAQRSLVAMEGKGSSGGIAIAAVSRNLGQGGSGGGGRGNADKIGGVGFARVASAVAGLTAEVGRPLSDGPGQGRSDEEIQIVFDRYKATLYRIYNKELRKDPTLRGKLLLRLVIEAGGEVSRCSVESSDLASAELVALIVERVKKFNFGPKAEVPQTTILYPIDFLPAG